MDPLKENLRAALNFSSSEKRGVLVLIIIMISIHLAPSLYKIANQKNEEIEIKASFIQFEKQLVAHEKSIISSEPKTLEYFEFDPNYVSENDLKKLGFPQYLAKRIVKFRDAGGQFYLKEDLLKIYGMEESIYRNVEPYINIIGKSRIKEKKKKFEIVPVNINMSDTLGFKSLKGIGPVFARRIVAYRQSLGGFIKIDQLKEVYGISDSLYLSLGKHIVLDSNYTITQININSVSFNELRKHPYFRNYNLSKVIINYREMNGSYHKAEDLFKIHLMTDSIFEMIHPYINFN